MDGGGIFKEFIEEVCAFFPSTWQASCLCTCGACCLTHWVHARHPIPCPVTCPSPGRLVPRPACRTRAQPLAAPPMCLPCASSLQAVREGFDPNRGLFQATTDQRLYPSPQARLAGSVALRLVEFLGKVLGKAMFEGGRWRKLGRRETGYCAGPRLRFGAGGKEALGLGARPLRLEVGGGEFFPSRERKVVQLWYLRAADWCGQHLQAFSYRHPWPGSYCLKKLQGLPPLESPSLSRSAPLSPPPFRPAPTSQASWWSCPWDRDPSDAPTFPPLLPFFTPPHTGTLVELPLGL